MVCSSEMHVVLFASPCIWSSHSETGQGAGRSGVCAQAQRVRARAPIISPTGSPDRPGLEARKLVDSLKRRNDALLAGGSSATVCVACPPGDILRLHGRKRERGGGDERKSLPATTIAKMRRKCDGKGEWGGGGTAREGWA